MNLVDSFPVSKTTISFCWLLCPFLLHLGESQTLSWHLNPPEFHLLLSCLGVHHHALLLQLSNDIVNILSPEVAAGEVGEHFGNLRQRVPLVHEGKDNILLVRGQPPRPSVFLELLLRNLVASVLCFCPAYNVAAISVQFCINQKWAVHIFNSVFLCLSDP